MMQTAAARFSPIIAHQYGWDEIAMFLVPIALAIAGVRFAEKRAAERKRLESGDAAETGADADDGLSPEAGQPAP